MPLVKIEIVKGHSLEYKKTLLQAVHDALVSALGIPDSDRYQRLYELDSEMFERSNKSDKFCLRELTIYPGRNKEKKGKIITEIARLLGERLDISKPDIFIVLHDPPFENWGTGGIQKG